MRFNKLNQQVKIFLDTKLEKKVFLELKFISILKVISTSLLHSKMSVAMLWFESYHKYEYYLNK